MALGLFRLMAAIGRDMIIANTGGSGVLMVLFLLGGFIIPKGRLLQELLYKSQRYRYISITDFVQSFRYD